MLEKFEQATADFLRSIWPAEGHYCIAIKLPKGMHQQWFSSIDDAAAFAVAASKREVEVYHACASFRESGSRKAENAFRAKAFWVDVDVGAGKPYADHRAGLAGILTFCSEARLPTPMVVNSGGGWHAYWPLSEALDPQTWAIYATQLKALCVRHNFQADPARTADLASILRPVGTYNYKRQQSAPVTLAHAVADIPLSAFNVDARPILSPALPPGVTAAFDNSKFTAKPITNEEPSSAAIASLHCAQLARFRSSQGRLQEPEWYAGICVLAHCTDGEKLAHEWSAGDERYSHADTSRKLEHARRDSGPTTCSKFQSLNAAPCVGCPYAGKVTSPIQLGRQTAAPEELIHDVKLPELPDGFRYASNGALQAKTYEPQDDGTTKVDWTTIYKCPIYLESMRENEVTGQTSLMLKHYLPLEGWLDVILPWQDHSQKVVLNHLGSNKINVHGPLAKHMLDFMHKSIDAFQARRKTEMEYAQFGWRNDFKEFLLGNELYTVGGAVRTIGVSPELLARARMMKPMGTFEGWRGGVQPLFVHPQQGLLVVAGFASIMMKFVTELSGVIVAAVSPEPRLGKTIGLVATRTIWGDDNAIDIATNDTSNSRFKMLSVLNGLPATWDDMRKSNDPEIIKQFVLSFSQGRDKNRLDRGGALRSNNSGWSSLLLATSNISIAELVGHDGETAQAARILEYRFKKIDGIKFSDGMEYERALRANRGTAGRLFLRGLMQPGVVDWCKHAVPACVAEYEKALASQQASFYASALACFKVTAILLNKLGMLEFSVDRVMNFAVECAVGMTAIVAEARADDVTLTLTRFVNESWQNALIVADKFVPKQEVVPRSEPRLGLSLRYEIGPGRIFIERDFMKKWCRKRNVMFHDFENQLKLRGILVAPARRINLGAGTKYSGAGQTSSWEVDAKHEALGGLRLAGTGDTSGQIPHAANAG